MKQGGFTLKLVTMQQPDTAVHQQNQFPNLLFSFFLNYVRWTQLIPMLMVWGAGLAMVLALTFVNFQEQTFSVFEWLIQRLSQLPIVGDRITQALSDQEGETHITTSDFKSFVLYSWSVISLAFMLAGMAISALFGPFEPWSLKKKFGLLGICAGLLLAGMIFNFLAAPDNFNGGFSGWAINFTAIALLVSLVSVYSLTVSHLLISLDKALFGDGSGEQHTFSDKRQTKSRKEL